jgi:hypothetical protein
LPGTPIPHHQFSDGEICLFVQLVLSCAVSQRSAAAVLSLVAPWLPGLKQLPCANAGRLWMLRLGLYELTRDKARAEDWIWIIDQTVQLGAHKALVIVGVRASVWNADRRPLRHEDLTLLNLTPLKQSTGEAVEEQLRNTAQTTGAPCAIVSDGGSELQKGMKAFRADHRQTVLVRDIKHQLAILLKRQLQADERFAPFVKAAQRSVTDDPAVN